mmetsp:Transcript_131797/g.185940  ORF Transcript_131797/g.185940 Transcript_131797/m.185940 type:complete len:96 (-) Transcript_131797:25-312(-)
MACSEPLTEHLKSISHLLLDEASRLDEVETILPLTHSPARMVMMGDTNQLQPFGTNTEAKKTDVLMSTMERLIKSGYPTNSLQLPEKAEKDNEHS